MEFERILQDKHVPNLEGSGPQIYTFLTQSLTVEQYEGRLPRPWIPGQTPDKLSLLSF